MDKTTTRPRRPGRALRRMPLGIALVAAALLAAGAPSVALGWDNYSFSAAQEDEMLTLINQARAAKGLPAYHVNSTLHSVARWRSKDMYDRDYFSHSIPNPPGGSVFNELHRRGVCYTIAGENIGWNNYPDDVATQTLFNGWMDSSGHRALILSKDFTRIGIGAFKGTGADYPKHFWTAVFTHPCGSSSPKPTPKPTPKPKATPHATPRPTRAPTAQATPAPASAPTPDPESLIPSAGHDAVWLGWMVDDGFDPGILAASSTSPPADGGGAATAASTTGGDGSLQVLEPPATSGLLDTIVGDVVASFLGK
jgi:uncharacterized protein YkwD